MATKLLPMTEQHPITPPSELIDGLNQAVLYGNSSVPNALRAAFCAGADQELEACVKWLFSNRWDLAANGLHAARRPKPPSLKAQAFAALQNSPVDPVDETLQLSADSELIIRRALALLNDND